MMLQAAAEHTESTWSKASCDPLSELRPNCEGGPCEKEEKETLCGSSREPRDKT